MGKFTSIVQFKGKVGELVGSRDAKGEMTVRKHQPEVKNPNTLPQVKARTRFLAASSLGTLLKNVALGLQPFANSNKISLRNAIVKKNMSNPGIITVSESGGEIQAQTDIEKIILSEGLLDPIYGATAAFDTVEGTKVGINVTVPANQSWEDEGRTVVAVAISAENNVVLYNTGDFSGSVIGIPFDNSAMADYTYAVHVYSMRTATQEDGYNFLSLFNGGSSLTGVASATLKTIAGKAEFSRSVYVNTLTN